MDSDDLAYKLNANKSGYAVYAKRKTIRGADLEIPPFHRNLPVLEVAEEGFWNRIGLKTLILPQGLKKIGARAFSWCCLLESVQIPPTVEEIGEEAFSDCLKLQALVIPHGVKVIGKDAFNGSNKLCSLTLPTGLTYIGIRAFSGCFSLHEIYFEGSKKQFKKIYCGKTRKKPDKKCDYHFITVRCANGSLIIYPTEFD